MCVCIYIYLFVYLFIHSRWIYVFMCRPGSVVGIATVYGLDGAGIESRWGEIFCTIPDRPWGPPSLLYNGYQVFPGGKVRPGRDVDPSPPSSAEIKIKSRAVPLLSLRPFVAYERTKPTYSFFAATVVTRTRLNGTANGHCLSWLYVNYQLDAPIIIYS